MPVLGFTVTVTLHGPTFTPFKVFPDTLQYLDDDGATFSEMTAPVESARLAKAAIVLAGTDPVEVTAGTKSGFSTLDPVSAATGDFGTINPKANNTQAATSIRLIIVERTLLRNISNLTYGTMTINSLSGLIDPDFIQERDWSNETEAVSLCVAF